ncbi:MAG: hypothetical protein LDL39_09500 [Magnetospirillum sp.]|nr:hypothetical protein [Magnetospirillum sp.]
MIRQTFAPRGIAPRVLILIVLFSSLVTLLATLVQLTLDYRRDVNQIDSRLDDIGRSAPASAAAALWNVDSQGLQVQMDGLMRLPDMRMAEVFETTSGVALPLRVSVGSSSPRHLAREFPLWHEKGQSRRQIGVLRVEAGLEGVYERLQEKVVVILVSQGIKTFVVSLFTLYIVHRLVTRHLVSISHYFSSYGEAGPSRPLALRRRPPSHPDEFDLLVGSFGQMATKLEAAHAELAGVNAELERDIAERQSREQALQQALDNLAAVNRELERFAFVASHDLQEPLRSIVSFAQLLHRHYAGKLDQRADEYIGFITAGGNRMHDLINDLLTYSRLNAPARPFSPVDLNRVCAEVLDNLASSIADSNAHIQVGPLPMVIGDETQLAQLLQNLLSNAIKFQPQGQAPAITVDQQDGVLRVTDNGIGMETTNIDPFEVFRRNHPAHLYPGTGMGLAICKRIVQRHGGTIAMDSALGRGTIFRISLPLA